MSIQPFSAALGRSRGQDALLGLAVHRRHQLGAEVLDQRARDQSVLEGSENIHAIGAIRTDRSKTFTWRGDSNGLPAAVAALDEFSAGASYLVGHNIIEHDLVLLARHSSHPKLLRLAAVDTLYLSPLAFPETPTITSSSSTRNLHWRGRR